MKFASVWCLGDAVRPVASPCFGENTTGICRAILINRPGRHWIS